MVSGDGRYLTKPSVAKIVRMAAANGVGKVIPIFAALADHVWCPSKEPINPGLRPQSTDCLSQLTSTLAWELP